MIYLSCWLLGTRNGFCWLTAAQILVALRWKHPDKLLVSNWILKFLDVIYLEFSIAHVIRVKESSIVLWVLANERLMELI